MVLWRGDDGRYTLSCVGCERRSGTTKQEGRLHSVVEADLCIGISKKMDRCEVVNGKTNGTVSMTWLSDLHRGAISDLKFANREQH